MAAWAGLPRLGLVLLAALSLVWGANWPVMKIALSELPPWSFRASITLSGAIGLFALARAGGLPLAPPWRQWRWLLAAAAFNVVGWMLLSGYGIALMPAGRASIIAFTMPLWVGMLGALVLGEALTTRRLVALGLGIGAIGLLIGPDLAAVGRAPTGALLMVAAAFSWACGTVVLKRTPWRVPVLVLTAWQLVIGGAVLASGALVLEAPTLRPIGGATVLAVAYNIGACVVFGHYAWLKIVSLFPAAVAGIGTLMIPVIGVGASALALDEPVGPREIAALGLVVAALATTLGHPSAWRAPAASPE